MTQEQLQEIVDNHRDELVKAAIDLTGARTAHIVERYAELFKREGKAPEVLVRFPTQQELDTLARLIAGVAIAERRQMRGMLWERLADNKEKARKTDIYDVLRRELFAEIDEVPHIGKVSQE